MYNSIFRQGNALDSNEQRFHLQNEQLEKRNTKLIEELERVMKKKNYVLLDSSEVPIFPKLNPDGSSGSNPNQLATGAKITSASFELSGNSRVNNKSKALSENIENFKKKNEQLQKEVDFLKKNIKKKYDEQRAAEIECDRMVNECNIWNGKAKSSKQKLQNLDKRVTELNHKLEDSEIEGQSLKKEKNVLEKKLEITPQNDPVIINQLKEEKEKLKAELQSLKTKEPTLQQSIRVERETNKAHITHLERQRLDMIKIFKKQSQLIENLMKQKVYFEAAKSTELTDSESQTFLNEKKD